MSGSGILGNRNFLLLWSGNAISLIGFHGVRIAYPLLALTLTGSAALAGWVGFAVSLPALIFQIPAGIAADRWDRRTIMIVCQLAGLGAAGAACLILALDPPQPGPLLMIAAFVEGTAFVFFGISELAVIRDVVDTAQRPAAFSLFEAEQPIALIIGRAAGATVYGIARWIPFVADAVTYLICLCTLLSIRIDPARRTTGTSTEATPPTLRSGVKLVVAEPFLRSSTVISGLSNMVIQVVILLIIVDIERSDRPIWTVGVVLGAAGVGGIIGSAVAATLATRFGAQQLYRAALWCWTALLVPIALFSQPLVVGTAWFGVGAVGAVVNVALTLFRVERIPEEVLGRAVGTVSMVTDGAVALGAITAGYLLSALGTTTTGWVLVATMSGLAVVGCWTGRSPDAPPVPVVGTDQPTLGDRAPAANPLPPR
ncbi:MFS transporter [Nocardia sp. NPDC003963]